MCKLGTPYFDNYLLKWNKNSRLLIHPCFCPCNLLHRFIIYSIPVGGGNLLWSRCANRHYFRRRKNKSRLALLPTIFRVGAISRSTRGGSAVLVALFCVFFLLLYIIQHCQVTPTILHVVSLSSLRHWHRLKLTVSFGFIQQRHCCFCFHSVRCQC